MYTKKEVNIVKGTLKNQKIKIEGLWTKIGGRSWQNINGNPACLQYSIRVAKENLPQDDNVYYGKIGPYGYLVHESELENC